MANKKQDKIFIKRKKKPKQRKLAIKYKVSESFISQILQGDKPVPKRFKINDFKKYI
jgi:hypothetical protein